MVIKRVGAVSCAKVAAALYMILGLIVGGLVSLASMAGGMASDSMFGAGLGTAIGIGAIIVLPLLYGCFGFIATLIGAWLYNAAASIVGGIEIDVQ